MSGILFFIFASCHPLRQWFTHLSLSQFALCTVGHLRREPRTESRIELRCYIKMYSPIARSVVLKRNRTIIDHLGIVFIHNAARSRLSPQITKPCKERIQITLFDEFSVGIPEVEQSGTKRKSKRMSNTRGTSFVLVT